jgi:hypothetical protein
LQRHGASRALISWLLLIDCPWRRSRIVTDCLADVIQYPQSVSRTSLVTKAPSDSRGFRFFLTWSLRTLDWCADKCYADCVRGIPPFCKSAKGWGTRLRNYPTLARTGLEWGPVLIWNSSRFCRESQSSAEGIFRVRGDLRSVPQKLHHPCARCLTRALLEELGCSFDDAHLLRDRRGDPLIEGYPIFFRQALGRLLD